MPNCIVEDENSVRMLEELAKVLNVGKSIVSDNLYAMEKIQKEGKWVLHKLSELTIQNSLFISLFTLHYFHKKKQYILYQIVLAIKNESIDNPSVKNYG